MLLTSKSLTSVCGETLFDSMLSFSRCLLDSRAQARLAAAKSVRVVLEAESSVRVSLWRKQSKISRNWASETGTLFRLTLTVSGSDSFSFITTVSGLVRLGASSGNTYINHFRITCQQAYLISSSLSHSLTNATTFQQIHED